VPLYDALFSVTLFRLNFFALFQSAIGDFAHFRAVYGRIGLMANDVDSLTNGRNSLGVKA
jgi:hypothetical protein